MEDSHDNRDNRNRDPLAIGIAVSSLILQAGLWFYWGGKIESRVAAVEAKASESSSDVKMIIRENATQDAQIAVNVSQYAEVIRRLGVIESQTSDRRP